MNDMERIKVAGMGRVDVTVGSALDIFGGKLAYKDVVAWHCQQKALPVQPSLVQLLLVNQQTLSTLQIFNYNSNLLLFSSLMFYSISSILVSLYLWWYVTFTLINIAYICGLSQGFYFWPCKTVSWVMVIEFAVNGFWSLREPNVFWCNTIKCLYFYGQTKLYATRVISNFNFLWHMNARYQTPKGWY